MPREQPVALLVGEQPGRVQRPGVRPGAGEVVGRQPPVEVRAARERLELGARTAGEPAAPELARRWCSAHARQSVSPGHVHRSGPDRAGAAMPRPDAGRCRQSVPNSMAAWSSAASSAPRRPGLAAIRSPPPASSSPNRVAVLDEHLALVERLGGVQLELGARVGDVEVAHGELADPVGRAERGVLGALHRQLVRVVGEVLARRCAGSCSPRRGAAAA